MLVERKRVKEAFRYCVSSFSQVSSILNKLIQGNARNLIMIVVRDSGNTDGALSAEGYLSICSRNKYVLES